MAVVSVVFDVGETLLDDTREFGAWADWIGVEAYSEADLYPDVRSTLAALREMGLRAGIAGNQTAKAGRIFRELGLQVDLIVTSSDWGVAKPTPLSSPVSSTPPPATPGKSSTSAIIAITT